jgi:hypothetical protein
MRRALFAIVLLFLLSAGLGLAAEGAAPSWEVPRFVIAGGGGSSGTRVFALTGTIGQAVVGSGSQGIYSVCSGFWGGPCGEAGILHNRIYLPLVVRNVSSP